MRTRCMQRFAPALLTCLLAVAPASADAALDRATYATLLSTYTRETSDVAGVRVDYTGLRREPRWRALVKGLETARPEALQGRDQRLAFWIDVYNILAIDTVVRNEPEESIRDVGSFFTPVWDLDAGRVGGKTVTLGQIEHQILRPLGEPRIHAAIVCASTSCPSLAREPFEPATLDERLDAAVEGFLASPTKGLRVDRSARSVTLSKIFDWFDEDFDAQGGVLAFVALHAPEKDRAWLAANAKRLDVEYFDYDWTLNDTARSGP